MLLGLSNCITLSGAQEISVANREQTLAYVVIAVDSLQGQTNCINNSYSGSPRNQYQHNETNNSH